MAGEFARRRDARGADGAGRRGARGHTRRAAARRRADFVETSQAAAAAAVVLDVAVLFETARRLPFAARRRQQTASRHADVKTKPH